MNYLKVKMLQYKQRRQQDEQQQIKAVLDQQVYKQVVYINVMK
jgi:hypothetical protein